MLHAPREEATLRRARRDYFGAVRNRICDHTKIVRGRTALGCRGGEGVSRPQRERLWGFRARRKVPVGFYSQLSGRENKHFSNSRSLTLRTVIGCAPTRQGRGRERWLILLEDINSYPEMCAEHVLSRSTSTPPIPVSAFFTAFFHSRARASSTGRAVTVLEYGYF